MSENHPPAYDPSSNGAMEVACKGVDGMLRTLKSDLEWRVKHTVPTHHPLFAWLVEHASWLMTIRPRLDNGRSPHQLVCGTKFNRDLLCFGEVCHYKLPPAKLAGSIEGKMAPRWETGVFLGYPRDSHEYVVWDSGIEQMKVSRRFQRMPESERFQMEHLQSVSTRPKDLLHRSTWKATTHAERPERLGHATGENEEPATRKGHVRGLKVTKKDLEKYGYTMHGCARCDHMIVWGNAQSCTCLLYTSPSPRDRG